MKKVESFPTSANAKFDWDTILNGDIWELTKGEDFTSSVLSMLSGVYNAAKTRGVKVRTSSNADTGKVWIQKIGDRETRRRAK